MDSFEFNKIAGAVLFTVLCIMSLGIVAEMIYEPAAPEKPGYEIEVAALPGGEGGGPAAATVEPIAVRLASADLGRGESAARKCGACHTFQKGEANKVGPNLWGIVGAVLGHLDNFSYSATVREHKASGDTWTYERLDEFLANPRGAMPGTIMAFAGVRRPEERSDIILYLRSLADSPVPLPAVAESPAEGAPPAEGEAPAEGAPPADGAAPGGEAPAPAPESPAPEAPAPETPAPEAPAPAPETPAPAPEAPAPAPETPPAGEGSPAPAQ